MKRLYPLLSMLFFIPFCGVHANEDTERIPFLWLSDVDSYLSEQKRLPSFDIDGATFSVLKAYLQGYENNTLVVNNERSFQILKSGQLACAAKKLRVEERLEFGYFTDLPQIVFPGLRLYMRATDAHTAGIVNGQQYALNDFLTLMPEARLGVVGGRHYGQGLQAPIEQWQTLERLYLRRANDMAAGLLDMLINQRIDLVLEYPNVLHHYAQELGAQDTLISVTLDNVPSYTTGYILCTRSPEGYALTMALNEALVKASQDRAYLDAQLQWFDKDIHEEMIQLYNQVYGTSF